MRSNKYLRHLSWSRTPYAARIRVGPFEIVRGIGHDRREFWRHPLGATFKVNGWLLIIYLGLDE